MIWLEIFGYIGTALVIISMLMTSVLRLRIINIIGSVISGIYAVLVGATPVALMNLCLICINVIVFLIAASPGYTDWYYQDVTLVFVDGAAKLKKVYGPLHNIYFVFLFSYFAMMIGLIFHAKRKKWLYSTKHALLLLIVVLLNILFWLVEQMIHWNFEFLSVSYVISELLLLCLYSMLQDIEEMQNGVQFVAAEETVEEEEQSFEMIVNHWSEKAGLSPREKDVFRELLTDKKRKDIAEALCVSENTVKTHTSNVFSKMEVSTRSELIEKVMK